MQEVIVIFDIGKTNKKVVVFDRNLNVLEQQEDLFEPARDEDGFECDDLRRIDQWIRDSLKKYHHKNYQIKAVNFSTYGASLVYLDEAGKPLTPLYSYLKPMPDDLMGAFYQKYGGKNEFCRRTASPALGFLNAGMQLYWMKKTKPGIFKKVKHILHFPQYCSYLLTGIPTSEYTSIGCHTAMWDFDTMQYHPWLKQEGLALPNPEPNDRVFPTKFNSLAFQTGTAIHDSSASLVPFLMKDKQQFILLSTGTWCISMNPFNYEPLTKEELENDCLSYLSIHQKPVKSSRFFMGHIHDVNLQRLSKLYDVVPDQYKKITCEQPLIDTMLSNHEGTFFKSGMPEDYVDRSVEAGQFNSFHEAYHQLMVDLTRLVSESINRIVSTRHAIKNMYVTGGFARNDIFVKTLQSIYPDKKVFLPQMDNATALGAALVVYNQV